MTTAGINITRNRGTDDRGQFKIAVRLSATERAHIERRAAAHGVRVSDVLRSYIAADMEAERARKRRRKSKPLAKSRAR